MTKYEEIRAMTVDEMAEFFNGLLLCELCSRRNLADNCNDIEDCKVYIKEYLESEAR